MKKRGEMKKSIMHGWHHFWAVYQIMMMDIIADMAKVFGRNSVINRMFDKHDVKAGYHLDKCKIYSSDL